MGLSAITLKINHIHSLKNSPIVIYQAHLLHKTSNNKSLNSLLFRHSPSSQNPRRKLRHRLSKGFACRENLRFQNKPWFVLNFPPLLFRFDFTSFLTLCVCYSHFSDVQEKKWRTQQARSWSRQFHSVLQLWQMLS